MAIPPEQPQPPQQPQQPQQPPVYAQPQGTNGFAIASLVLGIVWIFWIGSVLALVFGYIATSQIDKTGGRQGGKGLAIAGIVLGWIGIATLVLSLAFGNWSFESN